MAPVGGPGNLAIELEGVTKSFGPVVAVRHCDLRVEAGSFVSVLGPSGCGKTTLLRIIAGFEDQDRGTVHIQEAAVDGVPPNKRNVNTVFQRYALFPHKTVYENVVFPLEVQGVSRGERASRVAAVLDLVRLNGLERQSAATLSGGQAQRVALARALVGNPGVLLLDEPLAALDLKLRKAMQLELRGIQEQLGTTFLYVTHDQEEALTMSDTIVLMNDGEIAQVGTPEDVYERPANLFASQFIGETNALAVTVVERMADRTVVERDGAVLYAPVSDVRIGDEAILTIRPQRLRLADGGDIVDGSASNRLEGEVARIIFLGNLVHVHVRTQHGFELTVEAGEDELPGVSPGDSVEVRWATTDALLFEKGM